MAKHTAGHSGHSGLAKGAKGLKKATCCGFCEGGRMDVESRMRGRNPGSLSPQLKHVDPCPVP